MQHLARGLSGLGVWLAMGFAMLVAAAVIAPANAAEEGGAFEQIELSDDQIKRYIKAAPQLEKLFERIDQAGGDPDPALEAELERLAKAHGFKTFDELDIVASNVTFVLSGINDEDGSFNEPVEVLRGELADIKAATDIDPTEKAEIIKSIEESIAMTPKLKYPGNVDVVRKNLKALSALYQE